MTSASSHPAAAVLNTDRIDATAVAVVCPVDGDTFSPR